MCSWDAVQWSKGYRKRIELLYKQWATIWYVLDLKSRLKYQVGLGGLMNGGGLGVSLCVCVCVHRRGEMSSVKIMLTVNLTLTSFRHFAPLTAATHKHTHPHLRYKKSPRPNLFNTLRADWTKICLSAPKPLEQDECKMAVGWTDDGCVCRREGGRVNYTILRLMLHSCDVGIISFTSWEVILLTSLHSWVLRS